MRPRLGVLLLSLTAAACAAHPEASGAAEGDLVGGGPLASIGLAKVGDIPLGAKSSLAVLDEDRAIWGAFGASDAACSETAFTRYSRNGPETDLLPRGAWRRGRVSPNGRWVAAIGKSNTTCGGNGAGGELRVASTAAVANGAFAAEGVALGGPADFDFAGDRIVRFESDQAHAFEATGDSAWTVSVSGAPGNVPFHQAGPDGSMLVYAPGSALLVGADGAPSVVPGFPAFAIRAGAAPRATFSAAGTIVAELPNESGYDIWKITKEGAVRVTGAARMALYSGDGSHFAVVMTDGAARAVDVYDMATLGHVRIDGLDIVSTIALSASGDRVAASGTAGGVLALGSASTAKSGAFGLLGTPAGSVRKMKVLPDGRIVCTVGITSGASTEAGLFVAGTQAGSLKRLPIEDATHTGALDFEVEPGPTPTTVIAQKIVGHAVLWKLDGSSSTELPSYSANIAWTNGFDFYSFQDGASLGVVTASGQDAHTLIPNENPILGTRFVGASASLSGRVLFVAAGAGVYRIDTAATPAPPPAGGTTSSGGTSTSSSGGTGSSGGAHGITSSSSSSSSGSSSSSSSSGSTDRVGAPSTGSPSTGSPSTGEPASGGVSTGTSGPSTEGGGTTTTGQRTSSSTSSGGCTAAGGGASGAASPLALGFAALAFLRRRRRA